MPRGPGGLPSGGQGVAREGESEGLAEKFRAVVDETNRSAKVRVRSSWHYGSEGVCIPPWRTKVCAGGTEQVRFLAATHRSPPTRAPSLPYRRLQPSTNPCLGARSLRQPPRRSYCPCELDNPRNRVPVTRGTGATVIKQKGASRGRVKRAIREVKRGVRGRGLGGNRRLPPSLARQGSEGS